LVRGVKVRTDDQSCREAKQLMLVLEVSEEVERSSELFFIRAN
jgi:hypothetical protein